ncbi:MAG: YeeE/YedE family protein [Bacteroidales bacterium]|nr:YeeE/YedE family protein [Bacteroidales bacterium]
MDKKNKYFNPYIAGFFIGLLMIAAYYFSGEGLGASGAFRNVSIAGVSAITPNIAEKSTFFGRFIGSDTKPLNTWLIFEVVGLIAGALISAALHNRLEFKVGKSPKITNKKRLYFALSGGILWGIGSQLGRGCTSGLVMSGMAVNSISGYIGLVAIFGGGFLFAYFFRKLWI